MSHSDSLLRRALVINALFSTACAVAAAAAGPTLAAAMGLSGPLPLYVVGAGLLPFAAALVLNARRPKVSVPEALIASLGDFGWVLGSAVLLFGWPDLLSPLGVEVVVGVAAFVGVFGVAQLLGVRALVRNPDATGPRVMAEFRRAVDASPDRVWAVVSDVDGYAQYAPTLTFSRVVSTPGDELGAGTVRECGDTKGRWNEVCHLWDPGRRYAFTVDTRADDYPYPFTELRGTWTVEPRDHGSCIVMRFEVTMPGRLFGDIAFALLLSKFEPGVQALFDNWERAVAQPRLAAA